MGRKGPSRRSVRLRYRRVRGFSDSFRRRVLGSSHEVSIDGIMLGGGKVQSPFLCG